MKALNRERSQVKMSGVTCICSVKLPKKEKPHILSVAFSDTKIACTNQSLK